MPIFRKFGVTMQNNKVFKLLALILAMVMIFGIGLTACSQEVEIDDDDDDSRSRAAEKRYEASDAENIRKAFSEVTTEGLSTNANVSKTVELKQTGEWEYEVEDIAGFAMSNFTGDSVTVTYNAESGEVTFG